jgi:hypothetical protein
MYLQGGFSGKLSLFSKRKRSCVTNVLDLGGIVVFIDAFPE